jgi:membrane protein YqaA with SNARE-associated domain
MPLARAARKEGSPTHMADIAIFGGLFMAAFLAATLLPAQSEAVVVGLLLGGYLPWLVLTVASLGNILGSVVNWCLGRGIEHFRHRAWFPASPAALERAEIWYRKYGRWSLLLAWVPIIGDPLTVVAGVLRERFAVFLLLVSLAKIGRYLALAGVTLAVV